MTEAEAREQILALPKYTLFRAGWEVKPGRVQGSIFYRIGDGLGPTSRDSHSDDVLRRCVQELTHFPNEHQHGGIEVLAHPSFGQIVPGGSE